MLKLKPLIWMFLIGYLMAMTGCSHRPIYEKMNATYIVHLDMRHEDKKPVTTTQYKPEDVRDANMDLIDQMLNKEMQSQLNQE